MRTDYLRDLAELDYEAAARDRWTPKAAALRDEIAGLPWDANLTNVRGWAYSEVCDSIYAGVELTAEQESDIRRRLGMEAKS